MLPRPDICHVTNKPRTKQNYVRLSAAEFPELLRKIEIYDGALITRLALRLMALTFVRSGRCGSDTATWQQGLNQARV